MFNGKMKAITFSCDDGSHHDEELINLFDQFNLKATFNINSGMLGSEDKVFCNNVYVPRKIVSASKVKELYKNHEIAVHTVNHYSLPHISEEDVIHQVNQDKINLEKLCGYKIQGMAYPCGGENNNDSVAKIIKENTDIKFARTITSTYNFDVQENLYRFNPTVWFGNTERMFELAEIFILSKPNKPQIFYIWGHSYELEAFPSLKNNLIKFFKLISNKDDIFYGTNSEILLKTTK